MKIKDTTKMEFHKALFYAKYIGAGLVSLGVLAIIFKAIAITGKNYIEMKDILHK